MLAVADLRDGLNGLFPPAKVLQADLVVWVLTSERRENTVERRYSLFRSMSAMTARYTFLGINRAIGDIALRDTTGVFEADV